jgi:hypothetical protein
MKFHGVPGGLAAKVLAGLSLIMAGKKGKRRVSVDRVANTELLQGESKQRMVEIDLAQKGNHAGIYPFSHCPYDGLGMRGKERARMFSSGFIDFLPESWSAERRFPSPHPPIKSTYAFFAPYKCQPARPSNKVPPIRSPGMVVFRLEHTVRSLRIECYSPKAMILLRRNWR